MAFSSLFRPVVVKRLNRDALGEAIWNSGMPARYEYQAPVPLSRQPEHVTHIRILKAE